MEIPEQRVISVQLQQRHYNDVNDVNSGAFIVNFEQILCCFHRLFGAKAATQLPFNCSKSTIETLAKGMTYIQS